MGGAKEKGRAVFPSPESDGRCSLFCSMESVLTIRPPFVRRKLLEGMRLLLFPDVKSQGPVLRLDSAHGRCDATNTVVSKVHSQYLAGFIAGAGRGRPWEEKRLGLPTYRIWSIKFWTTIKWQQGAKGFFVSLLPPRGLTECYAQILKTSWCRLKALSCANRACLSCVPKSSGNSMTALTFL